MLVDGQTDSHDKSSSCFSQFWNAPKLCVKKNMAPERAVQLFFRISTRLCVKFAGVKDIVCVYKLL